MKNIFLILATVFTGSTAKAQQHQERSVLVYNISLGAITSGAGAVINKPKGTNWRQAFLKGAWQGAAGGFINYSGKKTLYLVKKHQNSLYALPARILHAAGNSIIENAALNEPFLQNWNIAYGPLRFDFSLNKKLKVRFLPEAIYAVYFAHKYASKFDIKQTLATGVLVFSSQRLFELPNITTTGVSYGRAIAYVDNYPNNINKGQLIAHEVIHNFQYEDYQVLNTWFRPLEKKVKSKTIRKIFSKYIYADIPYFWGFYSLQGRYEYPHYYKNFYEFEAQRFSTGSYVPR